MFIKLFYDNSNPGPVTPRRADAMPPTARRETTGSDRPARKQTGRQTGKRLKKTEQDRRRRRHTHRGTIYTINIYTPATHTTTRHTRRRHTWTPCTS